MGKRTAVLSSLAVALVIASSVVAGGTKVDVFGIGVKMSTPGDAYYDESDGTVTIEPWYDFAKIKVKTMKDADFLWGGYCDLFIMAPGMIVSQLQMKASDDTYFYVAGQTYHCDQFKGDLTFIGNTDAYGLDVGLGMSSVSDYGWPWPSKIMMKSGVCYAPLLALDYFGSTKSVDEALSAEAKDMLFGK